MMEKIVLAIAMTFSLYWIVQIKPPQRAIATPTIDLTVPELPAEMFATARI